MNKYICIHGHFYQPPRENPWLEKIEAQDSAYPYHDWNERINRECYAPNTSARALDKNGRIKNVVNNFEKISFNIGPTLFNWLKEKDPVTYQKIIDADPVSAKNFGGHGSAIAQVYSHMIMPLATDRDKETQVIWGVADFKSRFGRAPSGMWLSETAVDKKTLEIMCDNEIEFTILYQGQAKAIRQDENQEWMEMDNGDIDPSRPYIQKLSGGRSIAIFFYDGAISQAVAFEKLLDSGEKFVERLKDGFSDERDWSQITNIATDGETFGHHHRFGEMALTYALNWFDCCDDVILTNYGEMLAKNPPEVEVDIHENTAWSCAHGVGRWKEDCGCNVGTAGWNQKWRAPLRNALDNLKEKLDESFEKEGVKYFEDVWKTRNRYIEVVLDRGEAEGFVKRESKRNLSNDETVSALKLLESQRNGMLMFTSCGWFFDDVSGIETVQILKYSARAIQLISEVTGVSLEDDFVAELALAKSNITAEGTAEDLYKKNVLCDRASIAKVLANHVIAHEIEPDSGEMDAGLYDIEESLIKKEEYGDTAISTRLATISSSVTLEKRSMVVATLKLGAGDITCFVTTDGDKSFYENISSCIFKIWRKRELPEVIRKLDENFGGANFSLRDLFSDTRRKAADFLFAHHIQSFSDTYDQIFWRHRNMMDYYVEADVPPPVEFSIAAQYILQKELMRVASAIGESEEPEKLGELMGEIKKWRVDVDLRSVRKALESHLCEIFSESLVGEKKSSAADTIVRTLLTASKTEMGLDLWEIQNKFAKVYFDWADKGAEPIIDSKRMRKLAILLNFSLDRG